MNTFKHLPNMVTQSRTRRPSRLAIVLRSATVVALTQSIGQPEPSSADPDNGATDIETHLASVDHTGPHVPFTARHKAGQGDL